VTEASDPRRFSVVHRVKPKGTEETVKGGGVANWIFPIEGDEIGEVLDGCETIDAIVNFINLVRDLTEPLGGAGVDD